MWRQGDGEDKVSDQWLEPFVIVDGDKRPVGSIQDGDAVIIFNFRRAALRMFTYQER